MNTTEASILTPPEIARVMGISRWGVVKALHQGRLQGFKVQGRWHVRRKHMKDWIKERKGD